MKEECGLFGVVGLPNAASETKLGLYELQHRGQESCGIAAQNGRIHCETRMGLVMQTLTDSVIEGLPGDMAIGHTRYSTAGSSVIKNAQPFVADCMYGMVAVAHNGNLTNAASLKRELQANRAIFLSNSDTEVVLQLIAQSEQPDLINAIIDSVKRIEGSFCLLFLTSDSVIAIRDPHGFRPLAIGLLPNGNYTFASEACAFRHCDAEHIGDVKNGEIIIAKRGEPLVRQNFTEPASSQHQCLFEMVYFARPNSEVFGKDVHSARYKAGQLLALGDAKLKFDEVIGIPDSGLIAAQGYGEAIGKPAKTGLTKSHYTGRSFIQPTDGARKMAVNLKLSPVASVLKGRRVVAIDDSLVRGITSRQIIRMMRKAGAKEVHWRLASPAIKNPCYYGVDIPDKSQLIAVGRTEQEIANEIGADSVRYLDLSKLLSTVGSKSYCRACLTGRYPTKLTQIS